MKTTLSLCVFVFFLVSTAYAAQTVGIWHCFGQFPLSVQEALALLEDKSPAPKKPIIKVWGYADSTGKIRSNGIFKDALYRQIGIEHRWDFDQNLSDGTYEAAFTIGADGIGNYFHFGSSDSTKSKLVTNCKKIK